MALIEQSQLEAKLGRNLTSDEQTVFPIINSALQNHVERIIGSSVESVEATTRYYDGGVKHLRIDPCTSITSVFKVDNNYVAGTSYYADQYVKEPVNKTITTQLRRRVGFFWTGNANIAVTAKFSIYEDTDTLDIVKSSLLNALVIEITKSNNIKRESIEGYSVEYASTDTVSALQPIKYLFPEV